jgi:hypothetical protein
MYKLDEDIARLRIDEARQTGLRESRIHRILAQSERPNKKGLIKRIVQFILALVLS